MYDFTGYMKQYGSDLPTMYTQSSPSGGSAGSALYSASELNNLGNLSKKEWRAFKKDFDPNRLEYGWETAINTAQTKKQRKRMRKLVGQAGIKPFQIAQNQLEDFNNEMWDTADDVFGDVMDWATSDDEAVSYFDKIGEAQGLVDKQFDVGEGSYKRDMMRLGMNPERADESESRSRRTSLARAVASVDASNRALDNANKLRDMKDQYAINDFATIAGAQAQSLARMADLETQRETAYQQKKAASSAGTLGAIGAGVGLLAMMI